MKNIFFPIAVSSILLLTASCGTDNTAAEAQAQVDSIVASKTAIIENQLKRNNDSIINAMAIARADSMMVKKPVAPTKKDTSSVK